MLHVYILLPLESTSLFGVVTVQTFAYFQYFSRDKLWVKGVVCCILDILFNCSRRSSNTDTTLGLLFCLLYDIATVAQVGGLWYVMDNH